MTTPLCIETIRVSNGQLCNIEQHNQRLNKTRQMLYESHEEWDLAKMIKPSEEAQFGLFKCRVTYGEALQKIEFEPYQRRVINSLKLIETSDLDYSFKYQNRQQINALFDQRGQADDVLIVVNGFVTDTSYANVAFWDGERWLTPAQPLLAGTRRALLLNQGAIFEKQIRMQEVFEFSRIRIFNAMFDVEIPTFLME
jgi:4-amino-4-deoxychorismate lyase